MPWSTTWHGTPQPPKRIPRSIPDDWSNELFAALPSHRARVQVALWISTGVRASELIGPAAGHRSRPAVDRRGAQELAGSAAGARGGWRVRVDAPLPTGDAWPRATRSHTAGVVDQATSDSAAELSRCTPDDRMFGHAVIEPRGVADSSAVARGLFALVVAQAGALAGCRTAGRRRWRGGGGRWWH